MIRGMATLIAVGVLAACGPIRSSSHLLDADVQIEVARAAGAEKYAPYEWTAANLYLHKARELVGRSEYEVALGFSEKATKFAQEARTNAIAAAKAASSPGKP
jgi:hypothetical protein